MNLNRKVESETAQSAEDQERLIRHFEYRIPSNIEAIDEFVNNFKSILTETWVGEELPDDIDHVVLGFQEAINNAIIHGHKNKPDALVKVEVKITQDKLTVTVEDSGEGFDFDKAFSWNDPGNLTAGHGRGRAFMTIGYNRVLYDIKPGIGTTVTLIRERGTVVNAEHLGEIELVASAPPKA